MSEEKTEDLSRANYAAAPGVGLVDYPELPEGVSVETISFKASDGAGSRGVLYTKGGESTAVCFSHPRGDISQHYIIPSLLNAGVAAYSHQCRGLNNDVDCVHEKLLLDLGGGFSYLKAKRGFEKLVLFGNSGGGGLLTFYQEQATLNPGDRLKDTAAGDPCDLSSVQLPKADGLMLLGVHAGEGSFMLDNIDPSIVDEDDPLSIDPELDMYNPANGFKEPPEESSYSEEFLQRYKEAQRARIARLDTKAKRYIAEQNRYAAIMDSPEYQQMSPEDRIYISRRANVGYYMIIYRTEANPAYTDLSIKSWRSNRKVGSLIGPRADLLNYADGGFARYMTPRGWLSSWSGLSTRAEIRRNIQAVDVPLLMISYTADNGCYSIDNKDQVDLCPSDDKTHEFVDGNHYGLPADARAEAGDIIGKWLKERYPTIA